ncbi:3-oxoadipate enol-lactonase [Aeromicrobium sp. CTD01-1L150]|uniref:3-oxoadipate enol-lactonase n=1 Tax=Aeromicrobium sp. CTD01-1L150 TaxID=3341830 RepID=UPI0035C05AFA
MTAPVHTDVVSVLGTRLRIRIDGDHGPWVVLSNSLGCTLHMWDDQVPPLVGHRVLRYDARGHGGSDAPPGPYRLEDLAADLIALLDVVDVERATFVGLSMGGMLGQVAVLDHPARFEGLVLADTTSRYGPKSFDFWEQRARTAETQGLAPIAATTPSRWFTSGFTERRPAVVTSYQQMLLASDPQGYAACCRAIPQIDVTDRLHEITVPTAVVVGEHDPSTTVAHARRIHEGVNHSSMHILPSAAHLSNVEQPAAFTAVLLDLLSRVHPLTR